MTSNEPPNPALVAADELHHEIVQRCHQQLEWLPASTASSHLTAARLHRLPLSSAMVQDTRLHAMRPISRAQIRELDVVGHRALHPREIVQIDGLPVVGLADTWADLGELIGRGKPVGLDDTIVLGDAVATRLGSAAPLRAALLRRVRPRGKITLMEGLELIRVGSASPMETLSRIMFVRVGLPEPRINMPIMSEKVPGRLLGIADHAWIRERPDPLPDLKVVGEYQGRAFHSSPEQRAYDQVRRAGFEDEGWLMGYIWAEDMTGFAARSDTCVTFAQMLEFPLQSLDLDACGPRFFSQYALDLAIQRDDRWRHRGRSA